MNILDNVSISINTKGGLIRIRKNTLRAMRWPKYIKLEFNPDNLTVMVHRSSKKDVTARHVNPAITADSKCSEVLRHHSFIRQILETCPALSDKGLYLIYGKLSNRKQTAVFQLDNIICLSSRSK